MSKQNGTARPTSVVFERRPRKAKLSDRFIQKLESQGASERLLRIAREHPDQTK
jgi:hypothetical protein